MIRDLPKTKRSKTFVPAFARTRNQRHNTLRPFRGGSGVSSRQWNNPLERSYHVDVSKLVHLLRPESAIRNEGRGDEVRKEVRRIIADARCRERGKGWFCDDRKKKEAQLKELTSANDKLGVSAKGVSDLWCEIDHPRLVVRRCSRGSKDTLQMSAFARCVQSCDHSRLIRRVFQPTGDPKEREGTH